MVVAKDCPVSLGIMCGGTERYNKYGYIYYSDDKADDKDYIARANRYILIEAGNPDANIKDKNKGFVGSMQVPTLMNFASEGHDWHYDTPCLGSTTGPPISVANLMERTVLNTMEILQSNS